MTHKPYTYTTTGVTTYRLCATFQRAVEKEDDGIGRYGKEWDYHGRGPACYDLQTNKRPQ